MLKLKLFDNLCCLSRIWIVVVLEVISPLEQRILRKILSLKTPFLLILLIILVDSPSSLAKPLFDQKRRTFIYAKVEIVANTTVLWEQRSTQPPSKRTRRPRKTLAK